jgi:hypothetical protein
MVYNSSARQPLVCDNKCLMPLLPQTLSLDSFVELLSERAARQSHPQLTRGIQHYVNVPLHGLDDAGATTVPDSHLVAGLQ